MQFPLWNLVCSITDSFSKFLFLSLFPSFANFFPKDSLYKLCPFHQHLHLLHCDVHSHPSSQASLPKIGSDIKSPNPVFSSSSSPNLLVVSDIIDPVPSWKHSPYFIFLHSTLASEDFSLAPLKIGITAGKKTEITQSFVLCPLFFSPLTSICDVSILILSGPKLFLSLQSLTQLLSGHLYLFLIKTSESIFKINLSSPLQVLLNFYSFSINGSIILSDNSLIFDSSLSLALIYKQWLCPAKFYFEISSATTSLYRCTASIIMTTWEPNRSHWTHLSSKQSTLHTSVKSMFQPCFPSFSFHTSCFI